MFFFPLSLSKDRGCASLSSSFASMLAEKQPLHCDRRNWGGEKNYTVGGYNQGGGVVVGRGGHASESLDLPTSTRKWC